MTEWDAEAGRESHEAQSELLAPDRVASETGLELGRHPEVRRLVLHLPEVRLRMAAHVGASSFVGVLTVTVRIVTRAV